ncbi:uncharacterized protein isoform X1 [Choristoneura fumiferana]|uniref:uncharacterized protein isoform X1 n=1 Tax=Choristoneura fumiferana TaxID=7141 RepID=UPI003D157598
MLQKTLLFFGFALVASHPEPFFRKDYTYIPKFDAFYKVHWTAKNGLSWSSAFMACEDEESSLFYPKMAEEWTVVEDLVSTMKKEPNVNEVFVGMHYVVDLGEFITVDGNGLLNPGPINNENDSPPEDGMGSCVTMDIRNGSYKLQSCSNFTNNVQLFVCKKKVVVEACPTVDTGYKYVKEIGKCFKLHEVKRKTWKKAMETCFNEGGSLAILKNSVEAEIIRNKITLHNKDYFVGFKKMESDTSDRHFYTIHGHKFDNTFYIRWNHNETFDLKDDCGVIYKFKENLNTMTKNCDDPSPFLCEMLSKSYSWSAFKSPLSHVGDESDTLTLDHIVVNNDKDSIVFGPPFQDVK